MIIEPQQRTVGTLSRLRLRRGATARLAGDSVGVLVALVIGSAIAFIVQVMLARILGPEQFGVYTLVVSWVMTLSLFLSLGLDSSILRYAAVYRALHNFAALRGLLRRTTQIVAVGSLIGGTLMASASVFLRPELSRAFLVGGLLLPTLTLLQVANKVLVSIHQPICSVVSGQVVRHGALIAFIVVLGVMRVPLNASRVVFLLALAVLAGLLANQYFTLVYLPKEMSEVQADYRTREWVGFGLSLMLVTSAEQMLSRGDTIALGAFRSATEVGLYGAVVTLTTSMNLLLTSMNSVVAPQFAELHARRDHDGLQRLLTRASTIGFLGTLPLGLMFIGFGHEILRLFGKDFTAGRSALALLSIAYLIHALTGPVGLLLSMTGMQSLFARALIATACVTVGFYIVLVPHFGTLGAAWATMLGMVVRSTTLGIIAATRVGVVPTAVAGVLRRFHSTPAPGRQRVGDMSGEF